MSIIREAVSGVKWTSAFTVARVSVQGLSVIVLARILEPADFGLMSMAIFITGFAQHFSDFGLSNAIIHRQEATRGQLSSLFWVNQAVGLAVFSIIWIGTPLAVAFYQQPRLTPVLRWSAVIFLILPLGQQFSSLLRRDMRFKALSLIQITQSVVYVVSAIGLALSGFGVMSLVWAHLLNALAGAVLFAGVAVRSRWLPAFHFRRADLKGFLKFGLFQMGQRSLGQLANTVDYLIIGRFLGSVQLGYYTLAFNLMRAPLHHLTPMIVTVAFPSFARVQNKDDVLRRGYAKILRYLSTITFPIMAGMLATAHLFIPVVYGNKWLPAVPAVQIFCLLGALKTLESPLTSMLMAKGRPDLGFFMNLFAVIGLSISNIIGMRWGIIGVAASSLIFTVLFQLPIGFYFRRLTIRMTVREYGRAIQQEAKAASVMFVAVVSISLFIMTMKSNITALLILTVVGLAVYGLMIKWLDRPLLIEAWGYLKPVSSSAVGNKRDQ